MKRVGRLCWIYLTILLYILTNASALAEIKYTVTDLGNLGDDSFATAYAISNNGKITGAASYSPSLFGSKAFVYNNGYMTGFGQSGWTGYGINDSGQVTGDNGSNKGFLYSNNTVTWLGHLGGNSTSSYGINNNGQITGYSTNAAGKYHAFLYSNGAMSDLGTLGGNASYGYGINQTGQITGSSIRADGSTHAFLYSNGVMSDLGTLGGESTGRSINDFGQVAGYSILANGEMHAFLYSSGVMTDLGTLGTSSSLARAINNAGQITGEYGYDNDHKWAFLYENGVMTNLNSLVDPACGLTIYSGRGINNLGQICGIGTDQAGRQHAVLLNPIPEPATIGLLALGTMLIRLKGKR